MNFNEVIANRATEILGGKRGDYSKVHPIHHVNMHQSTNDVYPTALKVASLPCSLSWRPASPNFRRFSRPRKENSATWSR